jgi:hypothetical protein
VTNGRTARLWHIFTPDSPDRAFASWTFHGIGPAGEPMTYRGVDLFVFEGDLIAVKDAYRKERYAPIGG